MKITNFFTAITILSAVLSSTLEVQAKDNIEMCSKLGTMARLVMENRQLGATPSQILSRMKGDPYEGFIRALVNSAYETPRFATKKMQIRATQDFQSKIEATCFRRS